MGQSVRLRAVTRREHRMLATRLKDRTLGVRVHRRYRVIAEVRRGRAAAEVADRVGCHVSMVYEWIHRFNENGLTTVEQTPNLRGRPPTITGPQVRELIDIALSSPTERGLLPFSTWTVPKLAEYCRGRGVLPPITDERVRRLLRREGLRARRIRTWKTSRNPAFDRKNKPTGRSIGPARRAQR
jgi:transposase